jgi:hypothetical protein
VPAGRGHFNGTQDAYCHYSTYSTHDSLTEQKYRASHWYNKYAFAQMLLYFKPADISQPTSCKTWLQDLTTAQLLEFC